MQQLQRSFLCRWSALFVTEGGDGIEAAGAQGREEPAQSAVGYTEAEFERSMRIVGYNDA